MRSRLNDGAAESIAGHHDNIVALFDSILNHSHTVSGVVAVGLEVLKGNFVLLSESLAGLIGGLVEGLVRDITVVSNHGDFVVTGFAAIVVLLAAGKQGQSHDKSQKQRKNLFHVKSTFLHFFRLRGG